MCFPATFVNNIKCTIAVKRLQRSFQTFQHLDITRMAHAWSWMSIILARTTVHTPCFFINSRYIVVIYLVGYMLLAMPTHCEISSIFEALRLCIPLICLTRWTILTYTMHILSYFLALLYPHISPCPLSLSLVTHTQEYLGRETNLKKMFGLRHFWYRFLPIVLLFEWLSVVVSTVECLVSVTTICTKVKLLITPC